MQSSDPVYQLIVDIMDPNWEKIEENEEIKADFLDYHDGLLRHKDGLVLPPQTVRMLPEYKVRMTFNPPTNLKIFLKLITKSARWFGIP